MVVWFRTFDVVVGFERLNRVGLSQVGADSIYVVVMALGLGVIQWVFILVSLVIVV